MTSRALKDVDVSETLPTHRALVRDLQFTPDGRWLATCGWDRTCVVYKVVNGELLIRHKTLRHREAFVQQVAWAPKGGNLLTRLHYCIKIWAEDGACMKTIERQERVQSTTWLPNSKEFLSVEGSKVNKIDLTGKVVATYDLPRLALHGVAVTPDEKHMLGVATLIESCDGLKPLTARTEKRIVVYKFAEEEIENQVPVLHNVRDITIARDGEFALVSYDNKVPPQLWWFHRATKDASNMRLSLRRTYMPNTDVAFGGPSYFGGKKDELILCAGDNGHIHIWDRESADLLHDLHVPEGDLTGIAWNTALDTPMFATGSHSGAVKIWTSSSPLPNLNNPRSRSLSPSRAESPISIGNLTPPSIIKEMLGEKPMESLQLWGQASTRELPERNPSESASSVGQPLPEATRRSELPGRNRSASTSSIGSLSPETSRREPSGRDRSTSVSSTGQNHATRI